MKLVIVAGGRLRERYFREAQDEYLARIRRHLPIEVVEVERADRIAARLPAGDVVALDPAGQERTSEEIARWLGRRMAAGTRALTFVLGDADGLPAAALARAGERLSLGRITLPHRLARIVLLEQLYRALSILRGEPYHR